MKPLGRLLTWLAFIGTFAAPAVCGHDTDPLPSLSRLVKEFMVQYQVPGAALAIIRDNRLVYADGFGYADLEHQLPVSPRSLFRIASVSKPFTATAILQLVEQDHFRLDDPVLPLLKPTLRDAPGVPGDPRLQSVTIRHLLQHRAGWDRAQSRFFPLRSNSLVEISRVEGIAPPGTPDTVVRYMLAKPLDYTPGARYAYTNIGYLVLGRVIESITGRS